MKLAWQKVPDSYWRFVAETPRYRFVMVAPPGKNPALSVQHAEADRTAKPIDQRSCRNRRNAERIAQRFEDASSPRRLR